MFTSLPEAETLQDLTGVIAMRNHPGRYRIRFGNYRIGIEVEGNTVEVMRVLHRREFYRYFP